MVPLPGIERKVDKNSYEVSKRIFDLIVSIAILIFTLPLFLLIAFAIGINSPGPIIFSQQRIGMNRRRNRPSFKTKMERRVGPDLKGKPITIYKFRTMRMDVDPYSIKARSSQDRRLTVTGKFLRATSLDELPQILNVLRGDLSLVGPRPEMPFIVKHYGPVEAQRLLIKPGITGLWQIYGTRKRHIHENIQYDIDYIQRRSMLLDCAILIKTAVFILRIQNL